MKTTHFVSFLLSFGAAATAQADLIPGLVAYHDFEDLANDPLASGPALAVEAGTGSYSAVAGGVVGNTAEFTGTNGDFLALDIGFGGGGSNQLGSNFTVMAWYNLDTDAANASSRFFVFESEVGFDLSYNVRDLSGGTTYNDTQTFLEPSGLPVFPRGDHLDVHTPGTWQHVALTYQSDGTDTTVTTYIDGVVASSLVAPTALLSSTGINLGGARNAAFDRPFDGKIDEFAAWNRVLTPVELIEARQRGLAGIGLTTDLASLGKHFVGVAVDPAGTGSATGSGIYNTNDTALIGATANTGYLFSGWSGDFTGQPASFNHSVVADVNATAVFAQDTADPDEDGLTNYEELVVYNTLPGDPDSDGDQINDGDEVNQTGTDPNVGDELAIDYILANLCNGGAGPGDVVLSRDGGTNTVKLRLDVDESLSLSPPWDAVDSSAPGVGAAIDESLLELTLPGTPDPKRFFRFKGGAPSLP